MSQAGGVRLAAPPTDILSGASLFLDFDGTLVEIADTPDAVIVGQRLSALVQKLIDRLDGRVAIISGRAAAQVRDLIGVSMLSIAGSHGAEIHLPDGCVIAIERPGGLDQALVELHAFASDHPGMLVEDKPLGAALHYRRRPELEDACRKLGEMLAERFGLYLQAGKKVVELRSSGDDKGSALRRIMADAKMASGIPVFIGDDETDEPGFAAASELGGCGILVGNPRASAARYRLDGVTQALAWLEAGCAQ